MRSRVTWHNIPQMSRIQLKITRHTKTQEKLNLNEKTRSTNANMSITQMSELPDTDFKTIIVLKNASMGNYKYA